MSASKTRTTHCFPVGTVLPTWKMKVILLGGLPTVALRHLASWFWRHVGLQAWLLEAEVNFRVTVVPIGWTLTEALIQSGHLNLFTREQQGNVGNLVLDRIPTTPLLERSPLHLLYIENFAVVATSQSQASDELQCDRRSTFERFRTLCNQRVPSQVACWQTPTNKEFWSLTKTFRQLVHAKPLSSGMLSAPPLGSTPLARRCQAGPQAQFAGSGPSMARALPVNAGGGVSQREKTRVTHHMRLQHLKECLGVPQMATG